MSPIMLDFSLNNHHHHTLSLSVTQTPLTSACLQIRRFSQIPAHDCVQEDCILTDLWLTPVICANTTKVKVQPAVQFLTVTLEKVRTKPCMTICNFSEEII